MEIIAVNVGRPRTVSWNGQAVTTGSWKSPVGGSVLVRTLNLDGDRQADLSGHGGPDKAVYAYATEHYSYWRAELPQAELHWGAFGENLTTAGLDPEELRRGDHVRIGAAELRVTQPRLPCYKLNVRFARSDMVKRFLAARRFGVYFAVVREGSVTAGDRIELLSQDRNTVSVADLAHLYLWDKDNLKLLQRALDVPALPGGWRDYIEERLRKVRGRVDPTSPGTTPI